MKSKLQLRSGIALLLVVVSTAYAINYQYFSEEETTVFGDRIKFWREDTLAGVVRSNGQIAIMENPVFYDLVITSAEVMWMGAGYNPQFRGQPPIFNAPEIYLPDTLHWYRGRAEEQGMYFTRGANMQAWVQLIDHAFRMSWTPLGVPFDTTVWDTVALPDSAIVFFEGYLRISGRVHTTLIVCAGGSVGLEDNILYASTTHPDGIVTPGHAEKFALIAEGEMKILNTVANGRENSNGLGHGQTNREFKDIALNGIYVVLHESFTFENQNDPDSGYVCIPCGCNANGGGCCDFRGFVYLYGSLMQQRRGYVHRSSCSDTGYGKHYRFDPVLRFWNIGLFRLPENQLLPDALDFGTVGVGETAADTLHFRNDLVPVRLGGFSAVPPFFVTADSLDQSDSTHRLFEHTMYVTFSPGSEGEFNGFVQFGDVYYDTIYAVPVSGRGVILDSRERTPVAREFALSVYPNPFNARAEIRLELPGEESARLVVYDRLGRVARDYGAVRSTVSLDASAWPSGLYFVRAETAGAQRTAKLLLLR